MAKLYKLTDENGQTRGNTQWGEGVTHTATGDPSQNLCSDAWIHAYTDPLLAVFLNPAHANFDNPRLYEAEGEIGKSDHGLKVGCRSLTTTKHIPLLAITTTQRVAFAILCAREVYKDESFLAWSQKWLSGEERTESAARSAECSAYSAECSASSAADSAADSAACSARSAAFSAECSAYSAAFSAAHAAARSAASSAADSAASSAAHLAALSAAHAAERSAASSASQLDLVSIAQEALKY